MKWSKNKSSFNQVHQPSLKYNYIFEKLYKEEILPVDEPARQVNNIHKTSNRDDIKVCDFNLMDTSKFIHCIGKCF